MSSSDSTPPLSIIERVQDFVSEHKKAILLTTAAAAIAAGGVAYYASTSSRPRGSGGDVEKREKKKPGKGGKSGKKKKAEKDGPILEERKPKIESMSEGMCFYATLSLGATEADAFFFCLPFYSYKTGKMSN